MFWVQFHLPVKNLAMNLVSKYNTCGIGIVMLLLMPLSAMFLNTFNANFHCSIFSKTKFSIADFDENMATSNFDNWYLSRPTTYGSWNKALKNRINLSVRYTGPNEGAQPILTLADDVSSWEIGDKIVVAATNFDPRESETFFIVDCEGQCAENQVKVDRAPT